MFCNARDISSIRSSSSGLVGDAAMRMGLVSIILSTLAIPLALASLPPAWGAEGDARQKPAEERQISSDMREWRGFYGGPPNASVAVARSAEDWERLWGRLSRRPPAPMDAKRDMAIAIFLGTRPSGGYDIEITSSKPEGIFLVIDYLERKPEPGKMYTQALTTPYLIRLIPRTDRPVVFRKRDGPGTSLMMPQQEFRLTNRLVNGIRREYKEARRRLDYQRSRSRELEDRIRELQRTLERIRRMLPPGPYLSH